MGIIVSVLFVLVILLAYNNQRLTQENIALTEQLNEHGIPVVNNDPLEAPVKP